MKREIGVSRRAGRVRRSDHVVLCDRPPLELVRVEQRRLRPAAVHPAELPAQVVAVVDRRVHAGPAAGGDPVGGVADQECAPLPEPVGQLGGEPEAPGALDRDRQVGGADRPPDPAREPFGVRSRGGVLAGGPDDAVQPPVVAPGGQEDAARIRMVDVVDPVAVLAEERPDRSVEHGAHRLAEPVEPGGRDAELRPHAAVGAVSGDQVAGADVALAPGRDIPQRRPHAIAHRPDAGDLDTELDPRAVRASVGEQHRLEVVLGHARGRRGTDHEALLARRQADRHGSRAAGVRQRFDGQHQPLHVDAAGPHLLLEAPRPQDLHRPRAHRGRARQR